MNTSGEAAEQVMRMSLEGAEILIKLTGSGAKNAAVLLYSIYKEQNKTRGKERLTNMLRSGKPLKVYTFKRDNLEKFKEVAKEYGILYTVLKHIYICFRVSKNQIDCYIFFSAALNQPPYRGSCHAVKVSVIADIKVYVRVFQNKFIQHPV